ncbi:MAG: arginine deiminase family protein [Alphaproteobacteria bacterium]|jgi:N-dimethylarginine dimethylaminohydrolase|nr:arginine deiminase family protein [Alphaproteobacteria bacterium]MDP6254454.1 arginine deiminase family protein [Alphaproteobacteria bacterium]MDP7459483.1 arginine deiminase family protein [Alphaproteobacteria bacterium]HJM93315.1 arginine deiminase family protein [Alphaproteobacteria bacterium]|tara:strand:- start:2 stop:1006 length:1005 start_codon:yes stop_codon:yes gene_type:complete
MAIPKNREIYGATIKMFGSEPEPPFEASERQIKDWGREWGCDNDVGQIRLVLMHRPGNEFDIIDPSKRIEEIGSFGDLQAGWYWQSEEIPPFDEMQAQHDALADTLRAEGAEVVYLEGVKENQFKSVYTRDSAFAIKGGAIVSRMAPRMRQGEEQTVARTLANLGMPILRTISGNGMIEGGSFAWLNSRTAVVGRGIRVNDEAIEQTAEVLKRQGVDLLVVDLPAYSIHIDGWMLMIDVDLCLLDPRGLPYSFLENLRAMGIRTIEISPEDDAWIVNALAVRPGRVIMPGGTSNRTADELDKHGIEIITVDYGKMQLGGGGIHCSTCPLIRESV